MFNHPVYLIYNRVFSWRKIYLLILALILLLNNIKAKLNFDLNSEFGLCRFGKEDIEIPIDPSFLVDTKFRFVIKKQNQNSYTLHFRLRPELYKSYKSFKLLAKGSYDFDDEIYKGTINLIKRKNIYFGDDMDISFDLLILQSDITYFFIKKLLLTVNIGYVNQVIKREFSGSNRNDLDMISSKLILSKIINRYSQICSGIHIQRFSVKREYSLLNDIKSSWRIGPEIGFKYLKKIILNIDYRLLKITPRLFEFPVYEHYIRFLYGKIIKNDWSMFFLIDYYIRHFEIGDNSLNKLNLIFPLLNNENRIFFKITHDIRKNLAIYLKFGYYIEDLYDVDYSLRGWKAMLGIGIRN